MTGAEGVDLRRKSAIERPIALHLMLSLGLSRINDYAIGELW